MKDFAPTMPVPHDVQTIIQRAGAIPGARIGFDVLAEDPLVWVRLSRFGEKKYIAYFDAPDINLFL